MQGWWLGGGREGRRGQRARDLRHRIPVVSRELDAEILLLFHIRRDPEFLFGLAVPRIHIVVADRPIHELRHGWVIGFHLEIGRHEPETGSEPMLRPAGDAIIRAGEWPRAFLNEVALFRVAPVTEASLENYERHPRPTRTTTLRERH